MIRPKTHRRRYGRLPGFRVWSLSLALAGAALSAEADWAASSRFGAIAEAAVEESSVTVTLRLQQHALPRLAQLLFSGSGGATPERIAATLLQFSSRDGRLAAPHLDSFSRIEPPASKPEPGAASLPEACYEAVLVYAAASPLRQLEIAPPTGASSDDIALIVLHRGVPVSDLIPLGERKTLRLDRKNPWRSRFDDPGPTRQHTEPRSYVYVEPYEVRHEMLLRLDRLRPFLDAGPADGGTIAAARRPALKQRIGALLLNRNALSIDGTAIPPRLERVEFVRFSRQGIQNLTDSDRLDADTALVGVVLVYLTENPARQIRMNWDLFGTHTGTRAVSLIQGRESFDAYVTPQHPVFDWTRDDALDTPTPPDGPAPTALSATEPGAPWPLSRLAAGALLFVAAGLGWLTLRRYRYAAAGLASCWVAAGWLAVDPYGHDAGAAAPSAAARLNQRSAATVLQALLHNAYRAFELRDEEAAYDRLALSLGGTLLDDIYLQQRRAMLQQARGLGGEGQVSRIELLEASIDDGRSVPPEYRISARWVAYGTVSHWGHSHERQNAYRAKLRLRPDETGQWKILGMEFLDGRRTEGDAAS